MTAKLHEILAVEKSVESVAKKLKDESLRTFNKDNLFIGQVKEYRPFDESQAHLATSDSIKMETTVDENIDYTANAIAKYWDVVLQKDATNQKAKADIVVDGKVLAENVPVTFLLGLETKLGNLRDLYTSIPTLAPGYNWIKDEANEKAGVFKMAEPAKQFKSEKTIDYKVIVEPTQHQKAEIREVSKTDYIGEYSVIKWCGMYTPHDKARKLENLDKLLVAVRKARMRANDQKIEKRTIGNTLFDFINS